MPDYLLLGRHGVYYFRIRKEGGGELRLSLRTRDKKRALYHARKHWLAMKKTTYEPDWELEAEAQLDRIERGRKLVATFGRLDITDPLALRNLAEGGLGGEDLKAYIAAVEDYASRAPIAGAPTVTAEPSVQVNVSQHRGRKDVTLKQAIAEFLQDKVDSKEIVQSSRKSYGIKLNLFHKIVAGDDDNFMISSLTPDVIRDYRGKTVRLARHTGRGRTELIFAEKDADRISVKTRNSHFAVIKSLLIWAENQKLPIPEEGMGKIFGKLKTRSEERKRKELSAEDLKLLFESPEYQKGTFTRPSDFWCPLLSLFTSARQDEVCQLRSDDVFKDEASGEWVISITDDGEGKKLKNPQSKRVIPIHPTLRKLGFIKFASGAGKGEKLFPDEERNGDGHFGGFSKRFNRFKDKVGVQKHGTMKDFHSLRHTFTDRLLKLRPAPNDYIKNDITGHSNRDESENSRTYSSGASVKQKADFVFKVRYDEIDFSKVRPNGWKRKLKR